MVDANFAFEYGFMMKTISIVIKTSDVIKALYGACTTFKKSRRTKTICSIGSKSCAINELMPPRCIQMLNRVDANITRLYTNAAIDIVANRWAMVLSSLKEIWNKLLSVLAPLKTVFFWAESLSNSCKFKVLGGLYKSFNPMNYIQIKYIFRKRLNESNALVVKIDKFIYELNRKELSNSSSFKNRTMKLFDESNSNLVLIGFAQL